MYCRLGCVVCCAQDEREQLAMCVFAPGAHPPVYVSVWLALDDCDAVNGCLEVSYYVQQHCLGSSHNKQHSLLLLACRIYIPAPPFFSTSAASCSLQDPLSLPVRFVLNVCGSLWLVEILRSSLVSARHSSGHAIDECPSGSRDRGEWTTAVAVS